MRVPIPVVILLCLTVMIAVWWRGTRGMDFSTPPTPAELDAIRTRIEVSLPQADRMEDAIKVPEPSKIPEPAPVVEAPPPKPPIELGDRSVLPGLAAYREEAVKGPEYLQELALLLEAEGDFQRALLAWERLLDSTAASPETAATAISAVRRLRPTLPDWNIDPEGALPVTLNVGTGKAMAKTLAPVLETAARDIERASSGVVKVAIRVNPSKDNAQSTGSTSPPVALWLSGADEKSPSSEVMSFTMGPSETARKELLRSVFTLVRGHFSRTKLNTIPAPLADGEEPRHALEFHVTRLCWEDLAKALNTPPPKPKE